MATEFVLFGARRGTGLGARGVAGLALSKSVESGNLNLNKAPADAGHTKGRKSR